MSYFTHPLYQTRGLQKLAKDRFSPEAALSRRATAGAVRPWGLFQAQGPVPVQLAELLLDLLQGSAQQ
eukprot:4035558-Pyramimonas_sp.AAC.1